MRELTKNRFVVAMIYVVLFAAFIFSCAYLIKAFDLFIRFILKAFIPVLIGLFIATVFEPVLKYLEKRRINRTVSAILILVILNVLLAFMLAEGIYILVNECLGLVSNLQNIDYDKIYATLNHLFSSVKSIYTDLPRPIVSFIQSGVNEIANILNQVATMSLKVINVIPATLKGITIWFFSVLSSFFFMRDRHKMRAWLIQNFSAQVYKEMSSVAFKVIDSVVDYAKSQIILAILMFLSGLIGLSIIKAPYFLVISLLLGLLSIIPIIGSGIILLPWIIGSFIAGNTSFGIKLLIVYLIILGLREFASIKIVASQVGISTFTTLVSIYAGVEIFGAWGFIIGPLLVVFLKAVFETGAIKKIRENLFLQKRSEQA
ncbi:Beta tubulin, autoregulation binding site [Caldicellulosiruptor saccharolyticus DSM 8903]|uniref:Beta tubulin, autoregulation binding site n=1 Tax=Caldicellulosiruptor saccharolyticus (strain ATCC 43494 / DSM 8903 / Tp8T 6331) TaxID=351627 RepID=A4XGQ3_CALS8|nr:sporulation integral membrane protein YtvI [Caldicellulosiruptor saccharolyticus]ABP66088.1 Beta tubulin, autoregulation binding site [Caldicellulosiruptor saccharolyticus DSM 8903]